MEINSSNSEMSGSNDDEELEIEASVSFITKVMDMYDNSPIQFHTCRLQDAITNACMTPLEKRNVLCLYVHNGNDKFSSIFCENLKKPEIAEIFNRSIFFLGWDVEEPKYQSALIKALNNCSDLSSLVNIVHCKVAAALLIVPINDSIAVFSCIRGKVSNKDLLTALTNVEQFLIVENQQEKKLEELSRTAGNENDMGSVNYQKLMANMLGDRDYDSFEYDQHDYLKEKISFALLGPPQKEEGYEKKDMKKVEALYGSIRKNSNEVAKHKDKIEISFIYNCTEPLPSEKLSRAKKYKEEYNPNTDVLPLPIFVIRKCHGSENPCRIFIDNVGRSYKTWYEYISRNKLHQCEMILPSNGRYEVDENGEVLVQKHLSPACGIDSKLLQGADYLNTAGGLISGGIFLAAAIPTIAVAPAALIAGGVIGIGVGIYSFGRSAYTLYDRKRHKETMNFGNSEARGAYLNIVASSLGFVGVGATMAVSQLAATGVNIGQGAGTVVNTIGFVNMGASGVSMLNSGYDVIDHWYNENRKPSLLTIVQLRSSILFFGNIVYSSDKDSTVVDEAHARTMQDIQESLRNNRDRKPFLKLRKEANMQNKRKSFYGRIDIISPIQKIPNKDEIFDALMQLNDDTNFNGVRFTAESGDIKLNQRKTDIDEIANVVKDVTACLLKFTASEPDSLETEPISMVICKTLHIVYLPDIENLTNYVVNLLSSFDRDTKIKIVSTLAALLANLTDPVNETLDRIFSNRSKYFNLLDMIVCFFGKKAEHLEDQFNMWRNKQEEQYYNSAFQHIDNDQEVAISTRIFEEIVSNSFEGKQLSEQTTEELMNYFHNWFAKQLYDYQKRTDKYTRRQDHSANLLTEKIPCNECGGYYFKTHLIS